MVPVAAFIIFFVIEGQTDARVLLQSESSSSQLVNHESGRVSVAEAEFEKYTVTYHRNYLPGTEEYKQRFEFFKQAKALIDAHNSKPNKLWTAGINPLTDRSNEETQQLRGWRSHGASRTPPLARRSHLAGDSTLEKASLASAINWEKTLLMANDIPDQGGCGSCWAVASVSMLQARYEAQLNKSRTFSAQQLVNCVPNPKACGGTGGCEGATVELAMEYTQAMGLHENTPTGVLYTAVESPCAEGMQLVQSNLKQQASGAISTWRTLEKNKARPLMLALQHGPVAISLAATRSWNLYQSGIFDDCQKDSVVDHATVLFGYGHSSDAGKNYWAVRNSWGKGWGENGYIRMLRQDSPEAEDEWCGTDADPKIGTDCKPYPASVRVCGMCGMLYDSVVADFAH